jgi:hypothetical protein
MKMAKPEYRQYVEDKRKKGEKPLDEKAWESKVLGKGKDEGAGKKKKDKTPIHERILKSLNDDMERERWTGEWDLGGGHKLENVDSYENGFEATAISHKTYKKENLSAADQKDEKKLEDRLTSKMKKYLGEEADSYDFEPQWDWKRRLHLLVIPKKPEAKAPKAPQTPKTPKTPAKSYKKTYHKDVSTVMDAHKLTDDDAGEVKAFKKSKPRNPKVKKTDQQLMADFLAKAKPETKKRMKDVTPAEFMKMLGAIMEDEGEGEAGAGKKASLEDSVLRESVIKLAREVPEMRKYLVPLLRN